MESNVSSDEETWDEWRAKRAAQIRCSNSWCCSIGPFGGRVDKLSGEFKAFLTCQKCRSRVTKSSSKRLKTAKASVPDGHSVCNCCRQLLPNELFGVRFFKGRGISVQLKQCKTCSVATKSRYNKRAKDISEINRRPEERERERQAASQPHRKAIAKTLHAAYVCTDGGKQTVLRGRKARKKKLRESPGLRLQSALMASIRERLAGKRLDVGSLKLATWTNFGTIEAMLDHFRSKLLPGMTMENYGSYWSIGHRIPQAYYDFDDKDEIRKCNNPANLCCDYDVKTNPLGAKTNKEKSASIPSDDELQRIGHAVWPKVFGVSLSKEKRVALRKALHSRV